MTDEIPKNGHDHDVEQPPLVRRFQILPVPMAFVEPCECGQKMVISDSEDVQQLAAGHAALIECPGCQKQIRLELARILVAPNREMRRAAGGSAAPQALPFKAKG